MMSSEKRLIDANELLRDAEDYAPIRGGLADLYDVKWLVDAQLTVDAVEVVHGRWEDEYGGAFLNPRYRCSACKEKALYRHEKNSLGGWEAVQELTDYCPYCNAKMEE